MQIGTVIGDWVVEEVLPDGRARAHAVDSPFRKALVTPWAGGDRARVAAAAEALQRLQHPHVGAVLGLAESIDGLFLVSELVTGTDLRAFVEGRGLPLRTAVRVALEVADALAAAHARGLVHGDVRPERVVLGPDGRARLVGFEDLGTSGERRAGAAYRAPELGESGEPTRAGDAYAFGVLLYEVVRGSRARSTPNTSLSLDDGLPKALRDLVAATTHPDPVVRPELAAAREVLRESVAGLSSSGSRSGDATQPPPAREVARPTRIGRYEVVRELGRGGVGVVYEARDPVLERRVALKLLLAGTFARPREVQRFKLEAQAVARLDHPGIVKILDIGGDLEGAWFAMEYVDGPTLADRLRRSGGRLPWAEAVSVAAQVARALHHAHAAGLLHRDVKPNNVLLEEGPSGLVAKLADFGLALDATAEHTRMTGTGQVLGTPMYMSPEQAAGEIDRMGPPTDVYGLGVLLYECVTGRVPFDGATPLQIIANILGGNAAPLRRAVPELPAAVEVVCLQAIRLEPKDRYPTASAFADDLERCLAGEPVLAAAPGLLERGRAFARRNARSLVVAGVAGAFVALAFAATVWLGLTLADRAREREAAEALEGTRRRMGAALAAGSPGDAEAAFRTFVGRPEYARTRAMEDAWIERAAGATGEERLAALSSAFLAATDPERERAALLELGRASAENRSFDLLFRVTNLLVERDPEAAATPEVRDLRRLALAATRQLAAAGRVGGDDGPGRLLRAFSTATPTAWNRAAVREARGRRFVWVDHTLHQVLPGPELRADPAFAPVPMDRPHLWDWGPAGLEAVAWGLVTTPRYALGPTGTERLPDPPVPLGFGFVADLDGDGLREGWAASLRELYRLERDPEGRLTARTAHEETQRSNSTIRDLQVADFDADGRPDLVVSASEWGAYDLRVFEAGPGELELRGRLKMGVVRELQLLRGADGSSRILACKHDEYPNLRVFPEAAPSGMPRGLYEVRVDAEYHFTATRLLDIACGYALRVADFDGDGLDDAVVDEESSGDSAVLVQRPDGGLDPIWISGIVPEASIQADDDPALELVVRDRQTDGRTWVLGAGVDALPPREARVVPAAPPPFSRPLFRGTWARAEDLVKLGRLAEAERAFRDLATLRWGTPEGDAALARAGDLAFERGAHAEAAAIFLEAGDLAAAARSRRAARDDRGELQLLLQLRDRGALDAEAGDRLAALLPLASADTLDLAFDRPLDPWWEAGDPVRVRRLPDGLHLDAEGKATLLRVPVEWDGRWFGLEADLRLDRTEWGSLLEIALVPSDGSDGWVGVTIGGVGGGEIVERLLVCRGLENTDELKLPDEPQEVSLALWSQADGQTRCEARGPFGARVDDDVEEVRPPPTFRGGWDLVVRSGSQDGALARAVLRRLRLRGVRLRDPQARPDPVARAVVDGTGAAGADPWLRLAEAVRTHDDPAGALAALAGDPRADGARDFALHAHLDTFGPPLRARLGDAAWFVALERAWISPLLAQGRRDEALHRVLAQWTDGLEVAEPPDEDARLRFSTLLLMKAACALWRDQGDVARRALDRAFALGLPDRGDPDEVLWAASWLAVGHVDRAELAERAGDRDAALADLAEALRLTPVPLLLRDTIASRAGLAALREDPRWAALAAGGDPARSKPVPADVVPTP